MIEQHYQQDEVQNRNLQAQGRDKENQRAGNRLIESGGMQSIQESQMEERSFRKRQNMLSDIQAMIVDYKKKSNYSNLVGPNPDGVNPSIPALPVLTN